MFAPHLHQGKKKDNAFELIHVNSPKAKKKKKQNKTRSFFTQSEIEQQKNLYVVTF